MYLPFFISHRLYCGKLPVRELEVQLATATCSSPKEIDKPESEMKSAVFQRAIGVARARF